MLTNSLRLSWLQGIPLHRFTPSLSNQSVITVYLDSNLSLFWYSRKCLFYLSWYIDWAKRMKWNHGAMSTSGHCDLKPRWGSWPDKSPAFHKLDLRVVADANRSAGCEDRLMGNALETRILFLVGLPQTAGRSFSKEPHRVTPELPLQCPPSHQPWGRDSPSSPLQHWMDARAGKAARAAARDECRP